LYEHKEREGELEDELKSTIQTKNKVEDDLHQDKRQLKSVERELASVLSDKERISNTKQLLEKELRKQEDAITQEKEKQSVELRTQIRYKQKLERFAKQREELKLIKTDLTIEQEHLVSVSEDVKNELLDTQIELKLRKRIADKLTNAKDELEEDLDDIEQSKLQEQARLKKVQDRNLEKLKHDFEADNRKSKIVKSRIDGESQDILESTIETKQKQSELKLSLDLKNQEAQLLSKELFETNFNIQDMTEDAKVLEKDNLKTTKEIEEEKKKKRDQLLVQHKLRKEGKKINKDIQEGKILDESLSRETSLLEKQAETTKENFDGRTIKIE